MAKYLSVSTVQRIKEAANSWLTFNMMWQKFGPSSDGAVERDMRAAESQLRAAMMAIQDRD